MTSDALLESIQVIFNENTIVINDIPIKLRPREMDYFDVLYSRRGHVLLYDYLINRVHGSLNSSDVKNMQVNIHYLNKKLNKHGIKIATIRKRGYKLATISKGETNLSNQAIEIEGIKKTVKEWCALYGLRVESVYNYNNIGVAPLEYILNRINKKPLKRG